MWLVATILDSGSLDEETHLSFLILYSFTPFVFIAHLLWAMHHARF